MVITPHSSRKISNLNSFLILLVLYIHTYFSEASGFPVARALQCFWGTNGISRVAVPLFFLISGILFFNNIEQLSDCFVKQRKRVSTLLIPYILWNIIFVLWYVVVQMVPIAGSFLNADYVDMVFGHGALNAVKQLLYLPVGFHLWFLRDLIIMVTFAPVLFLLLKSLKWLSPVFVAIFMYALLQVQFFERIDYEIYCLFGVVYFTLGGTISSLSSLEQLDQWLSKPAVVIAAVIFFGNAVWQIFGVDFNVWYNFLTALAGCIVVWKGYDWVASHKTFTSHLSPLTSFLGYSFFIFLFHEPSLNVIKKLGLKILGIHEWSLILLYVVTPFFMAMVCIAIATILKRYIPKLYNILTGNR